MSEVELNAQFETNEGSERPNMRPPMNRGQRKRAEIVINGLVCKQRRKNLGLTQVELAIMSATSPRTIAMIERGKNLDPPTSVTLRIAKALSVTVEALTAGSTPFTSRTTPRPPYDPEVAHGLA